MKRLIYLVLFWCLLSCNQETRKILTELPNEIENFQDSNELTEGEKVANALSEMTPLSEDVLRNVFPKQMKGLSTDENAIVLGQQVVGSFGDRRITLSIVDAAGPNNQIAAQIIDSYAFNKPQETEDFKVVNQKRDGIETHAEYYKYSGKSEMSFLFNKRFYISLSNDDNLVKLAPDELWEAFDISALEPLNKY